MTKKKRRIVGFIKSKILLNPNDQTFSGCTSLTSVEITGVTYIEDCAFYKTSLTSVEIPASYDRRFKKS
jgi:hypothetical protein